MGYNNRQYEKTFVGNPSVAATVLGGTAMIFSGAGTLHGIVVGTTTGTAFLVFDTAAGQTRQYVTNGSTAMVLKASVAEGSFTDIDMSIANGLYVTFGINGQYTVLWSQGS